MIEALNLIPARNFPVGFYVRLFLLLCVDSGGLMSHSPYELHNGQEELPESIDGRVCRGH
jgi:hypothetical protein